MIISPYVSTQCLTLELKQETMIAVTTNNAKMGIKKRTNNAATGKKSINISNNIHKTKVSMFRLYCI
jgi:hypothetical protein